MKKFWNIFKKVMLVLSVTAFVVLFVFTLTSAVQQKKSLVCSSIQVKIDYESGVSFLTTDEITAKVNSLAGGQITGKPLSALDFRAIEMGLQQDPFVQHARVYIDHARTVHAEITQKQPIIRIINNDGVGYYLSDMNERIPLSGKFTAHVPVAIGEVETREDLYGDSIILSEIYGLAKYLQHDSLMNAMIDHAYVRSTGDLELYTKMGYHTIEFGRADESMQEKFDKLKTFYRDGLTKVGWERYSVINLKYKGQVIGVRKGGELIARAEIAEVKNTDTLAEKPAEPIEDQPADVAADKPAKPAADKPRKPAADKPAKPAADKPAKPAASEPAPDDKPKTDEPKRPKPKAKKTNHKRN
ncbi:MAG: hypothetical protein JST76_05160 [Bacteroidetes bacterium]|nr:hypothetical protein [Bacteroidota bacterium]